MMRRPRARIAFGLGLALLVASLASPGRADEIESPPLEVPQAAAPTPAPTPELAPKSALSEDTPDVYGEGQDFEGAIDYWNSMRPWRYGTQYLFALTRGMKEAGIPRPYRYPLWLLTVPADVISLPVAAVGGLYGN